MTVNGSITTTTTYVAGELEEISANGTSTTLTTYFTGASGLPTAERVGTNGPLSYLATDGQGTVSAALDNAGTVTSSQLYTPYGVVRYSSGSSPTTLGYTGQRADSATGLDDYQARYYDPVAGQFTSADTANDGLNHYGYVGAIRQRRPIQAGTTSASMMLAREGDSAARRIEARAARKLTPDVSTAARKLGCSPWSPSAGIWRWGIGASRATARPDHMATHAHLDYRTDCGGRTTYERGTLPGRWECHMNGPIEDTVRQMSIEQLIGQLLMVGFPGTSATPDVLDLIASSYVGNIILFSRNLDTPGQIAQLTTALQMAARAGGHPVPLLIATDQENGIVQRTGSATTRFPGNMALGAINSEETTEAVARATGEELRALGISMNLAPVVDVSNNPENPVIGVRSFGADPELVARMGAAATRGYQAAGVVATLKHFPGHGDTAIDSHVALPAVTADIQRLEAVELAPFRRAIAAGAEAVMTAHVAMPAITGSNTLPATLAPEIIQGLLRDRLGFTGIVITDCLEMRAISADIGIAEGAVRALQAGADIVLISHQAGRQIAALNAIRAAVGRGDLPEDMIRAAAARVLRLKQRLLTWDDVTTPHSLNSEAMAEHQGLANDIYARSITTIRDDAGLLPLNVHAGGRVLVVSQADARVSQAADRSFSLDVFADALKGQLDSKSNGTSTAVAAIALPASPGKAQLRALQQHAAQAEIVILLTCNAHLPQHRAASEATARVLLATRSPIVGIAVCDPYDAAALPEIHTWLATYDYTPPALEAAARVLVGALPSPGTLPVPL